MANVDTSVILLINVVACFVVHGFDKEVITTHSKVFPELDEKVIQFLTENDYLGAAIGVLKDGKLVHTQGYGSTQDGETMSASSLVPVSSISKTITAVGILKLVEEDKLMLDEPVFGKDGILHHLYPRKHHPIVDQRIYQITVEQLLYHTAGWNQAKPPLYDPLMNKLYLSRGHNVTDIAKVMGHHGDLALNDIIRYMLSQPLDFTPGLKYQYCNLCYSVLGRIIEAVSGKEYRSYIQDTILTPLGMWHTRIGPHHSSRQIYGSQPNLIPTLKFEDGYILLGNDSINSGVNYALLDSTLGWYSNVYDMMRLMKGIEDIIKPETLELMLGKPFIFEHSDTWHGIGFRIHNHNTWWQTADSHDNELVLYHQNGGSSGTGRHKHSPKQRLSWVIFLNGNQRKNVHKLTADIVNSVEQWPSDDHFIDDCSDSLHELKDGKLVLMKYRLPEHHLQAYGIALANYQYYPIWISGYTVQDRTYFSIICQQDPKTDHLHVLYKLFYDLDSYDVEELFRVWPSNDLETQFITSYVSHRHNRRIRHIIAMGNTFSGVKQVGWHERLEKYSSRIEEWRNVGYMPVIQSIKQHNGQDYVTLLVSAEKQANWKSYTDLTVEDLERAIKLNAKSERTLSYLDTRTDHDTVLFSAIFHQQKLGGWLTHVDLSEDQLIEEINMLRGLPYIPKIITGYELEGKLHYAVMWVKYN